jgi:hypothetical protein
VISKAQVDALVIHQAGSGPAVVPYSLSGITGLLGSPQPRADVRDRPRYYGVTDRSRWYTGRIVDLTGRVYGDDQLQLQNNLDQLRQALRVDTEHVLQFRRIGFTEDEQVAFRIQSALEVSPPPWTRSLRWSATLLCSDPRIFSSALHVASYDPTVGAAGAGLVFPLVFPLDFGAGAGGTLLTVANAGTIETPPLLQVTGPVTGFAIDNQTTIETIEGTDHELLTGEVMVIDVVERLVTINGEERAEVISAEDTVWFELPPYPCDLRLRGDAMVTGQTELQVTWRDARI